MTRKILDFSLFKASLANFHDSQLNILAFSSNQFLENYRFGFIKVLTFQLALSVFLGNRATTLDTITIVDLLLDQIRQQG